MDMEYITLHTAYCDVQCLLITDQIPAEHLRVNMEHAYLKPCSP